MDNTSQIRSRSSPSLPEAVERLAFPVFLFSIILFGFLFLSWVFLLPSLSQVRVGGERNSIRELQSYHRDLTERLQVAIHARERLVLPVADPVYTELRSRKIAMPFFLDVAEEIRRVVREVIPEVPSAVSVEQLRVNANEGVLEIRGRTGNVGPRSMTILAQFTDALSHVPFIASLEHPTFTREKDVSGFFSPFFIRARFFSSLKE